MYQEFAQVYDDLMTEIDYNQWSDYLYRLLLNKKGEAVKILEVACGTGNITIPLKEKGFDIRGIDISEEMLTIADNKAQEKDLDIPFYLADMSNFSYPEKVDAVICAVDSVNYLESLEDLAGFFEGAYEVLEDNGLLLFDLNTVNKFKNTISDNTFVYDLDDVYCVWNTEAKENKVDYDITFFRNQGDDTYKRYEEKQSQWAYSTGDIYRLLKQVGFKDIKIYNFGTFLAGTDENDRVQVVAEK